MTEPDDRELQQYLKGGSRLSQRYREASGERAPPELDAPILAQARAEVARRRRQGRPWFSGLALAASLVLAVNLGWNVYQSRGSTLEMRELDALDKQNAGGRAAKKEVATAPAAQAPKPAPAASGAVAPAAPAPEPAPPPLAFHDAPRAAAESPAASPAPGDAASYSSNMASGSSAADADSVGAPADKDRVAAERKADADDRALAMRQAEKLQLEEREAAQRRDEAARAQEQGAAAYERAPYAAAAPEPVQRAKVAPLSESQKVDRLLAYIGGLQGARFIRNGSEYSAADAAAHLRLKRDKAGDRVKTADDFIRYCASYSSVSSEAYLIKFSDGRTRTAEDVLREELGRINAGG